MAELGVPHVELGCQDKVAAFDAIIEKLGIDRAVTAYVGDDVPDLELLRHAGFAIAVANAAPEVKAAADAVTTAAGGAGAVREVCDRLLAAAGD